MRLPGRAELAWEIVPSNGTSVLIQTARFVPNCLWGHLYRYALLPLHGRIFAAMARAVVGRARRYDRVPRSAA